MLVRYAALALTLVSSLMILATPPAQAQAPGVTDKEILLCSYQPMTGNESTYFRMGKGADIWYRQVNEQGGVNGRKINFKMVDDQYNPSRTTVVVKEFVERDKCFAIANPLGSAPTSAVIDYIAENKVPLIGAGTGAAKNLEIPSKYVFPLYPSYNTEGQDLVRFAKEQLGAKTISLLYQNDPSGKTHLAGVESVLDKYGVKLVAKEPYEKNELDVSAQTIKIKAANPDVHLCSCAPEHAARFLTERQKLGWKAPVVVVFFGQSPKVVELAGKEAVEGVYFSTIFRRPNSPDPQMRQFVTLLKKYYPNEEPDAIHMWGYAGAQVVTEALGRMPKETSKISRDGFVEALETIRDWKGGLIPVVNIGKGNAPEHFLIREMSWLQVKNGDFEVFTPKWMK
jgi:branched-chain amino acid transport system substrate-binding protein